MEYNYVIYSIKNGDESKELYKTKKELSSEEQNDVKAEYARKNGVDEGFVFMKLDAEVED